MQSVFEGVGLHEWSGCCQEYERFVEVKFHGVVDKIPHGTVEKKNLIEAIANGDQSVRRRENQPREKAPIILKSRASTRLNTANLRDQFKLNATTLELDDAAKSGVINYKGRQAARTRSGQFDMDLEALNLEFGENVGKDKDKDEGEISTADELTGP